MGWVHDSGYPPAYDHQGYAQPVLDLDLMAEGEHLRTDWRGRRSEVAQRHPAAVTAWQAACSCGWVSTTAHSRDDHPVPDHSAHLGPEDLKADGGAIEREWTRHLHQAVPELALHDVLADVRAGRGQVEEAVRAARAGGASWAAIGRAADITRQTAHERWSKVVRNGTGPALRADRNDDPLRAVVDPDGILDRGGRIEILLEEADRAPEESPAVFTAARAYDASDVQIAAGYGESAQAALAALAPEKAPAPVLERDLLAPLDPPF